MATKFRRHLGAAADVKELEYISALHQTCMPHVRENGTVSSEDVAIFLKSRVGLNVPEEHGLRIVRGLGGGVVGDDVIQTILKDTRNPHDVHEKAKKRIRERIRLAVSLGALKGQHVHRGEAIDDIDSSSDENEAAETAQVLAHLSGSIDDPASSELLSLHNSKAVSVASAGVTSRQSDKELAFEDTPMDVENPCDGKRANREQYLDLVQIMGIILMPTLARAGKEWHDARLPQKEEEETPPRTYEGLKGRAQKLYDSFKDKQKQREEESAESLRPKPENIIPDVLKTMLNTVHHDSLSPAVLDAELVRKLLIMHGECERAADPILIDKMVEAATAPSGLLDEEGFVRALTGDLSAWTVGYEDRDTSSFFDVWGYDNYYEKALMEIEKEEAEKDSLEALAKGAEEAAAARDKKDIAKGDTDVRSDGATFQMPLSYKCSLTGEAVSLVKGVEAGGVDLVKQAGTNGVKLAKEAGTGGVNLVKEAEAGGALEWKAQKKQLEDTGVIKFMEKLLSPADKPSHVLETEAKQPSCALGSDRHSCVSKAEWAANEVGKLDYEKSRYPKERHFHLSKKSGTSKPSSEATGGGTTSNNGVQKNYKIDHARSIIAIDSAIDGYSSALLMVGIFVFFICTSIVYASLFQQMSIFEPQCNENFSCLLVDKIITWAIFAVFLSLTGYFVIIPLSTGNNPVERSPFLNIATFTIALAITWIPYAAVNLYKERQVEEPYDKPEKTVNQDDYTGAQYVTNVVGCIVAGMMLLQFIYAVIGNRRIRQAKWLSNVLLTCLGKGSGRSKRAATRKVNKLLQNASNMKPRRSAVEENITSDFTSDISEEVMINFVTRGETFEECGGFIWTWKQLFSGSLFEEEGIWIMSRLLVIQTIQAMFIGFKAYALTLLIKAAVRWCQEWQDNL